MITTEERWSGSESENITEEFSVVLKNFCAKPSSLENFADAPTDFAYSVGNLAENSGQGILILKTEELLERAGGHVAQWKELLSHSGEDAGSKSARESRRAHTILHAHFPEILFNEKEENQARSLKKASLSLRGISRGFYSSSEIAEPHALKQVLEDEVFKTFAFPGIITTTLKNDA